MTVEDPLGIHAMREDLARLTRLVESIALENQQAEYTVSQVAKLWNKSNRTINRYIAQGRVPVIRHGQTPMIRREIVSQGVPQSPKP